MKKLFLLLLLPFTVSAQTVTPSWEVFGAGSHTIQYSFPGQTGGAKSIIDSINLYFRFWLKTDTNSILQTIPNFYPRGDVRWLRKIDTTAFISNLLSRSNTWTGTNEFKNNVTFGASANITGLGNFGVQNLAGTIFSNQEYNGFSVQNYSINSGASKYQKDVINWNNGTYDFQLFPPASVTGQRGIYFPDKSGTVALQGDTSTLIANILSRNNTWTGTNEFNAAQVDNVPTNPHDVVNLSYLSSYARIGDTTGFNKYFTRKTPIIGTIYNKTGFTTLSDFTTNGVTASVVSGNIRITGSTSDYVHSLDLNGITLLDRWNMSVQLIAPTLTSTTALAIGTRSINSVNAYSLIANADLTTSGTTSGQLTYVGNAGLTVLATSANRLTFSAGDTLAMYVSRDNMTVTTRMVNKSHPTVDVSTTYQTTPLLFSAIQNRGTFSIFAKGSDPIDVISIKISSESPKDAVLLVGDSKFEGRGATVIANALIGILGQSYPVINMGGGSDATPEVLQQMPEIIATKPRLVLLCIGRNDLSYGTSVSTIMANLLSITNQLTSANIQYRVFTGFWETTVNQDALAAAIRLAYPNNLIDNLKSTATTTASLSGDSKHPSDIGNYITSIDVKRSGVLDSITNTRVIISRSDIDNAIPSITAGSGNLITYDYKGLITSAITRKYMALDQSYGETATASGFTGDCNTILTNSIQAISTSATNKPFASTGVIITYASSASNINQIGYDRAGSLSAMRYYNGTSWSAWKNFVMVDGVLGTPTSGNASNLTNIPVANATGVLPVANGGTNLNATQTTVSGSTSGNAKFSQPEAGTSSKRVIVYMAALVGTASYTFPTAFTNTPVIVTTNGPAAGIVTALSTTAMTVTGATTTGFIILEGY